LLVERHEVVERGRGFGHGVGPWGVQTKVEAQEMREPDQG
jgi:hypothetical protein